jgi:Flp pilus assembly protein TadG
MTSRHAHAGMHRAPAAEHARTQKGSVLIEFAFVLPVFLMLLFGVVTFSLALYNKTILTMASREGARAAAIYVEDRDVEGRKLAGTTAADNVMASRLITFGDDTPHTDEPVINGDIISVRTHINYTGIFYLISGNEISATSSMRLETKPEDEEP